MTQELQDNLFEKYPQIFQDRNKSWAETRMCDGICCGDGWYDLIDKMCEYITSMIEANPHTHYTRPVALQVKEKFGGLRFYLTWVENEAAKKHKAPEEKVKIMSQSEIDGIINFTEFLSNTTCEVCGKRGEQFSKNNWVYTRCTEHKEQLK